MVDRPLRIVMVAPPWFDIPPEAYGGIEQMIADLSDELVARGHDVTVAGRGRSETQAGFVQVGERPDASQLGASIPEITHAADVARALEGITVDIVHDHSAAGPLLARGRDTATVVTAHGPVTGELREYYRSLGENVALVAISAVQERTAPELSWAGVVHNSVRVDEYPLSEDKEDFVVFLGRMNPEKAPHLAIEAARAAGYRIVLAGKCAEPAEQEFFDREVEPRLGSDTEWIGEVDREEKKDLLRRARCLLFPIQWEEPFGLVMIEANACGTPVVALRRGAVPEVVTDGVNGFVRDEPEELAQAVRDAGTLDPARCREHLRGRFDPPTMAAGYERIYRSLVGSEDSGRHPHADRLPG